MCGRRAITILEDNDAKETEINRIKRIAVNKYHAQIVENIMNGITYRKMTNTTIREKEEFKEVQHHIM